MDELYGDSVNGGPQFRRRRHLYIGGVNFSIPVIEHVDITPGHISFLEITYSVNFNAFCVCTYLRTYGILILIRPRAIP